jgi:Rrf2 family protein
MLKINKRVEYALIALKYLSGSEIDKLISAREICDRFHLPFDPMAKVLQQMNNAQLLHSIKGVKGGYLLKMNLSELSFMTLSRIIEKQHGLNPCENHLGICEHASECNIQGPIKNLNRMVHDYLENVSVQNLLFEVPSALKVLPEMEAHL